MLPVDFLVDIKNVVLGKEVGKYNINNGKEKNRDYMIIFGESMLILIKKKKWKISLSIRKSSLFPRAWKLQKSESLKVCCKNHWRNKVVLI